MAALPQTPRRLGAPSTLYENAPPPTPRSSQAREIQARLAFQTSTTLTISSFTSLIASLTASHSPTLLNPRLTEQTRLDRIEAFRLEFLCGEFQRERPPELMEDAFSDGTRASMGGASSIASSEQGVDDLPFSPIQRGLLAEAVIKARLKRERVLLSHSSFKAIAAVARKAMTRALATGKEVYVSCGLLRSPSWVREYEEQGWAAPGIRFGNFKPDLIRFTKKEKGEEGEVVWEVIEVKYSGSDKEVIYANYKIQATFYHLALTKLLSTVPLLSPSHKVTIFLSRDPRFPTYVEKPIALRTNLAFVEHHLFNLLPTWLHAVTLKEWELYDARRLRLAGASMSTPVLDTPALSFLEKLRATQATPSSPSLPHPLCTTVQPSQPTCVTAPLRALSSLPSLPDEDDEDLAELFDGLGLAATT